MADNLTLQLTEALKQYSKISESKIKEILKDVAVEAKNKLRETSPKRLGQYRKGWRVKIEQGQDKFKVRIQNKNYYLTHLLENGHRTRNHRNWVPAQVHIAPVESWANQEVETRIRKELSE